MHNNKSINFTIAWGYYKLVALGPSLLITLISTTLKSMDYPDRLIHQAFLNGILLIYNDVSHQIDKI